MNTCHYKERKGNFKSQTTFGVSLLGYSAWQIWSESVNKKRVSYLSYSSYGLKAAGKGWVKWRVSTVIVVVAVLSLILWVLPVWIFPNLFSLLVVVYLFICNIQVSGEDESLYTSLIVRLVRPPLNQGIAELFDSDDIDDDRGADAKKTWEYKLVSAMISGRM